MASTPVDKNVSFIISDARSEEKEDDTQATNSDIDPCISSLSNLKLKTCYYFISIIASLEEIEGQNSRDGINTCSMS